MTLLRWGVYGLWCVAASGVVAQTPAPPPASLPDRTHIQQQRQAIDHTLRQQETACYQRFAVEDCLRKVRQHARQAQADLRQQAAALDADERRERADQRLHDIAERERMRPAAAPLSVNTRGAAPHSALQPSPLPSLASPADGQTSGQQTQEQAQGQEQAQAKARARQQQNRRKAQQTKQAKAMSAQAAEAAQARQARQEKNAAAAQRRARVLQSQAEAAAAGRTPAAPLSPAP